MMPRLGIALALLAMSAAFAGLALFGDPALWAWAAMAAALSSGVAIVGARQEASAA